MPTQNFIPLKVTNNVPGGNGLSQAKEEDFVINAALPADLNCIGGGFGLFGFKPVILRSSRLTLFSFQRLLVIFALYDAETMPKRCPGWTLRRVLHSPTNQRYRPHQLYSGRS